MCVCVFLCLRPTPMEWTKPPLCPLLSSDYIRGGCQGLCQGAEEQVQDQALLCQTPTHGLPARPDHPGGRQHGNVSLTHTHTLTQGRTRRDSRFYYKLWDAPTYVTWIRGRSLKQSQVSDCTQTFNFRCSHSLMTDVAVRVFTLRCVFRVGFQLLVCLLSIRLVCLLISNVFDLITCKLILKDVNATCNLVTMDANCSWKLTIRDANATCKTWLNDANATYKQISEGC